jgi:hypothetical protein
MRVMIVRVPVMRTSGRSGVVLVCHQRSFMFSKESGVKADGDDRLLDLGRPARIVQFDDSPTRLRDTLAPAPAPRARVRNNRRRSCPRLRMAAVS